MHEFLRRTLSISTLAAVAAFSIGSAFGQAAYKATVEAPAFDDIQSPQFGGTKNKAFTPKDWLELESMMKIEMLPVPPSKTCEKLTVKWYIAVKNPEKKGYLLLTKEVEHVNVPLDQGIFTSVYLSPASILRLTGSDKSGKGIVESVGIEVMINGQVEGSATYKGAKEWWKKPSENLSQSDSIPLLTKPETPFADMWWDRYAEVAAKKS